MCLALYQMRAELEDIGRKAAGNIAVAAPTDALLTLSSILLSSPALPLLGLIQWSFPSFALLSPNYTWSNKNRIAPERY